MGPATPARLSRRRFLLILAAAGAMPARAGARGPLVCAGRSAAALGAAVNITVVHDSHAAARAALDAALAEVKLVDELMSLYRPDSQVSILNRDGSLDNPHPYLVQVLVRAGDMSRLTQGAFDITVQPLWELYSVAARSGRVPDDRAVRKARRLVDWRGVEVSPRRVALREKGMAVTLNAIAQGFAADRAAAALRKAGAAGGLVDAGEIAAVGRKADGSPWTVGIQHPRRRDAYVAVAKLADRCMATSGDYATAFTDDRMYHHIFDPLTGRSPRELASATVAAPSAADADALATAMMVAGVEKSLQLAQTLAGVDVFMVRKTGQVTASAGFPA